MKKKNTRGEVTRVPAQSTRLRLILVRHGESKANVGTVLQGQSEGELTDRGIRQADQLGIHLKTFHINRMLASDLRRVRQTVAQISRHLPIPVEYSPLVREWNVGNFDGQPLAALKAAVRASGQPFFAFQPQGGERLVDVAARARKLIENLGIGKHKETVLVVSHGDFLRMVLGVIQEISLEDADRIHLDNTSYSVAELDLKGQWKILAINNTDHMIAD